MKNVKLNSQRKSPFLSPNNKIGSAIPNLDNDSDVDVRSSSNTTERYFEKKTPGGLTFVTNFQLDENSSKKVKKVKN